MDFVGEYADGLKARLRAAVPDAIIEERFSGANRVGGHLLSNRAEHSPLLVRRVRYDRLSRQLHKVFLALSFLGGCLTIRSLTTLECMILATSVNLMLQPESCEGFYLLQEHRHIVHAGGSVGATDLLSAPQGEVIEVDMSQPIEALAAYIEELIGARSQRLADVGRAAAAKARSWTETANAEQLVALLQSRLDTEPKVMATT